MLVKIGNIIYDPSEEPIIIILNEQDKKNICSMSSEHFKYCCFPEDMDLGEIEKILNDDVCQHSETIIESVQN